MYYSLGINRSWLANRAVEFPDAPITAKEYFDHGSPIDQFGDNYGSWQALWESGTSVKGFVHRTMTRAISCARGSCFKYVIVIYREDNLPTVDDPNFIGEENYAVMWEGDQ